MQDAPPESSESESASAPTVSVEITPELGHTTAETEPFEASSTAVAGRGAAVQPYLERGTAVGRYLILNPLGEGGMGRVYLAYDPDLDRRIALKLLRPSNSSAGRRRRLENRLLEEARTLARTQHPHVVTVFDVGTIRLGDGMDRVFVSMELVDGQNLGQWARTQEPSVSEVLEVFSQAGRGLLAAHEAGIVHRDFKPGNVMVGRDGRVRVCDFGLARPTDETGPERPTIAGTPAFMAPEQWSGREVGPAADQYAFCISLARILGLPLPKREIGSTPFPPPTPSPASPPHPDETGAEGPSRGRIPSRVEKVVRRGIAIEPSERYPSMQDLLAELEHDPWRQRGLPALGVLLLLVLLVGFGWQQSRAVEACAGGPGQLAEVWNGDARQRLDRAFQSTGKSLAGEAFGTTARALDQRGRAWADQFGEACHAHRRGEQSDPLLDRRMICLEERRQELGALVETLIEDIRVEAIGVEVASAAVATLPSLDRCRDVSALLSPLPLPPSADGEAIETLRSDLARTRALRSTGAYDRALEGSTAALSTAREIGYWPSIAEALLERGLAEESNQDAETAEATFRQTLLAAEAGRHDRVAVEAFLRLVRLASYERGKTDEARELAAMGGALLEQLGERRRLRAVLENHLGLAALQDGDREEAIARHRRALELLAPASIPSTDTEGSSEELGDVRLARARTHVRLGNALLRADEPTTASAHYGSALRLYRSVHGERHPEVAIALERLGGVAATMGNNQQALELRREAVEILRAAHGEDHPHVADALANLGLVQIKLDAFEEALATFQRVEEIYGLTREEDHPKVAVVQANLGTVWLELGNGEEALRHFRRALGLRARALGPDHPATGVMHFNLGSAQNELALPAEALENHRRAYEICEKSMPEGHSMVAHALTGIGRSWVDLGRYREARPNLERAMKIWSATEGDPIYPARTEYHLARLLWETGETEKALELAEKARATFDQSGGARRYLEKVERWLSERSESRLRSETAAGEP